MFKCLSLLLMAAFVVARAETPLTASVEAPPLRECQTEEVRNLGLWDDVLVCGEQDSFILKRGEDWFILSAEHPDEPTKLAPVPGMKSAKFVGSVHARNGLWVFLSSSPAAAFAVNTGTGQIVAFDVPGFKVTVGNAPYVYPPIFVRSSDAVLLKITGQKADDWPRDEDRPLYFWASLLSGKTVLVPPGWDLRFFSADQKLAVFQQTLANSAERPPLQALDMDTGQLGGTVPDCRTTAVLPFERDEPRDVEELSRVRENTKHLKYLDALLVDGTAYPVTLGSDGEYNLATAKARDGFVAFQRMQDAPGGAKFESALWQLPLESPNHAETIAEGVKDYALLDGGNGVFTTQTNSSLHGYSVMGGKLEGWFHEHQGNKSWNVLDGIAIPPDPSLPHAAYGGSPYSESIRLTESFGGNKHPALVLCRFHRVRLGNSPPLWEKTVLLTSNGERYMTDLPAEKMPPSELRFWLHNSGRLFTGRNVYSAAGKQIQLSETTLSWK